MNPEILHVGYFLGINLLIWGIHIGNFFTDTANQRVAKILSICGVTTLMIVFITNLFIPFPEESTILGFATGFSLFIWLAVGVAQYAANSDAGPI